MGVLHRNGVNLREMAQPSNPPSGEMTLFAKSDHKPYYLNDGGGAFLMTDSLLLPFSIQGVLAVQTGALAIPILYGMEIEGVAIRVTTAPTGASLIVDVNKNGTTIYGTQANRPTIAASGNNATGGAMSVVTLVAGDYLTVDIDQVGSTVAGSNLVVNVALKRNG